VPEFTDCFARATSHFSHTDFCEASKYTQMQRPANHGYALDGGKKFQQSSTEQEQNKNVLSIPHPVNNHYSPTRHSGNPKHEDVLLGRGRGNGTHPGNCYYNQMILEHADQYNETTSRNIKSQVAGKVMKKIKGTNGRFVKLNKKNGTWVQVSDHNARMKTTQALRYQFRKCASKPELVSSSTTQQQSGRTTPLQLYSRTILEDEDMDEESEVLLSNKTILENIGYAYNVPLEASAPVDKPVIPADSKEVPHESTVRKTGNNMDDCCRGRTRVYKNRKSD
jgi:hypothetical protein